MNRVIALPCWLLLAASLGCSTLGFPTNPVAHTMSHETKQVLAATPRNVVAVPRELAKLVLAAHYLEPGDELLIESNDIESEIRIPADQQVSAEGSIDLGKYGRLIVASLTLEQAEELIQSVITRIEEKQASINVRLIQSVQQFYVVGEVNSPGAYPFAGNETVLDAIMAAGGLTSRASACDMILARPTDPCSCRVTLPVCYRAITQLGDTTTNYQVKPGDRIFVGRQSIWEELKQCCCAQKSCERCCGSQRACRSPLIADQIGPSFASADTRAVSDPTQSDLTELPGDIAPITVIPLGDREVIREQALNLPPVQSAPPTAATLDAAPRLDGELDFDELPNQR